MISLRKFQWKTIVRSILLGVVGLFLLPTPPQVRLKRPQQRPSQSIYFTSPPKALQL
jgi:hypothetical protein